MSQEPVIKVENVFKVFGPNPEKAIKMTEEGVSKADVMAETGSAVGVYDASFDVYEGETVVVMGLSGSGKSTLLRCLNRLHEPSQGKVTIEGTDVTALNESDLRAFRQKKFGMIFQRFALLPHRTVLDNVAFGLELQKVPYAERIEQAEKTLSLVGLDGWGNSFAGELSGGMQQRVGIARALAVDPDILLMDEAFSALDPLIRSDMQDELMALQDRLKKTTLFITHDLDEALKVGDRIVLMKDGKIVQIGTPEDILKDPATRYVERFVENVNRTNFMTAEDVMVRPATVTYGKDGPKTALHVMREHGVSSVFILDKGRRLKGFARAEKVREEVDRKGDKLDPVLEEYIDYVVPPEKPLPDILPIMVDNRYPVAVVDEERKLLGMIVKGSVIAGITEGREE